MIIQPSGGKHEKKREIAEELNTACLMMRSKQIHQPVYARVFNLCLVRNDEKVTLLEYKCFKSTEQTSREDN